MPTRGNRDDTDVLTTRGEVVHIRTLGPADQRAVERLHERASDRSLYLRFFTLNRSSALRYAAEVARPDGPDHHSLGAFAGDVLRGVAGFERIDAKRAEFALLVDDSAQHTGVGTLLLEHLAAIARRAGVEQLVADVLLENARMVEVLHTVGLPVRTALEDGVLEVEVDVSSLARAQDAIADRERTADVASLQPLLAPRSVAVVGGSARPGSVGEALLRNILDGGFRGELYAVNPKHKRILGVETVPDPGALPVPVDLAVLAVPAAQASAALRACGERGCRAAVVVASGFGESGADGRALQDELLATARSHGMRLVGPNCLGVANTDPQVALNATFGRAGAQPGPVAVAAQSGAFGAGVIAAASASGLGLAQFVSLGNKADVGGNDLLLAWAADPAVRAIALYLESIGDPRRFVRIARSVAARTPVLAVKSGRTEVGRRAGQSHTAAAASSDAAVDALFNAAGVVRVDTMQELVAAARVVATQPMLDGPRLAIVGNSGGPQILAADAAAAAGLVVPEYATSTRAALDELGVSARNPLDLGAAATPKTLAAALAAVHADPNVDAVLTVFTEIAVTDLAGIRDAVVAAARFSGKPSVAVEVGGSPRTVGTVPVFDFPEPAAKALGDAWRCSRVARTPIPAPARPTDVDPVGARQLARTALTQGTTWLSPDDTNQLLDLYGIRRCAQQSVRSEEQAVAAARAFGFPVVVKLGRPGLHKSDVGGVRTGLRDEDDVDVAARELLALSADSAPLVVQPMLTGGTELIVGAVHDAQFGPMVMVGAGGTLTEVLRDRALRLAPLSRTDAAEMIAHLRIARVLDGYRGTAPVSRDAVLDVVLRIAALVDDVPEIAELDLNPLICRADDVVAVDARIRVAVPPRHPDPLVRQLRGPSTTEDS